MAGTRAKKQKKDKPQRGWFARLFRAGLLLAGAVLIALVVAVGVAWSTLPEIDQLKTRDQLGQVMRVRAADGSMIVSIGPIYGEWMAYKDIPPVMVDAMVSIEDKRFRSHLGVDPFGLARAAKIRLSTGRWTQGASTITQQLARNIFLTSSKTYARKWREMLLALAMERKYSKNDIIELYLNRVYFGGGAYGVDAASRRFFDHPAKKLSLSEAAIIAGLVKAPSSYSPTADAQAAVGRAGVVINSMVENGKITQAEAKSAVPATVKIAADTKNDSARYFTDWALPQLEGLIEPTNKPIDVWTTLDLKMQDAGINAVRNGATGSMQGALVSLDRDGAVRAMVGGKDYVSSIYNRATQSTRQPGSAFKLFVYLAALEAGKRPNTPVVDEPVTIGDWQPKNSSGHYSGKIDLRTAFTFSINTVAAKLGAEVGTGVIASMARRLGITTPINTQPSMVLGTSDVRLIDMTRAFATISAKGQAISPYAIVRVTTTNGQVLYEHRHANGQQLVEPWVASAMTDLLQSAVSTGTGKNAQIGRPVAGKTGTTQTNKDGWFLGFSSGLTTGVWIGADTPKSVPDLQGGRAPARTFASFMKVATAGRPVEQFDTKVKMPDWQLPTEEQTVVGSGSGTGSSDPNQPPAGDPGQPMVDPNGNPIGGGDPLPVDPDPQPLPEPAGDPAMRPEEMSPGPQ